MATMLGSVAEGLCLSESLGLNNDALIEVKTIISAKTMPCLGSVRFRNFALWSVPFYRLPFVDRVLFCFVCFFFGGGGDKCLKKLRNDRIRCRGGLQPRSFHAQVEKVLKRLGRGL